MPFMKRKSETNEASENQVENEKSEQLEHTAAESTAETAAEEKPKVVRKRRVVKKEVPAEKSETADSGENPSAEENAGAEKSENTEDAAASSSSEENNSGSSEENAGENGSASGENSSREKGQNFQGTNRRWVNSSRYGNNRSNRRYGNNYRNNGNYERNLQARLEAVEAAQRIENPEEYESKPRLEINELTKMSMIELRNLATQYGLLADDLAPMKKQDLIFSILKAHTEHGGIIFASGALEILPDGYGFLRSPQKLLILNGLPFFVLSPRLLKSSTMERTVAPSAYLSKISSTNKTTAL